MKKGLFTLIVVLALVLGILLGTAIRLEISTGDDGNDRPGTETQGMEASDTPAPDVTDNETDTTAPVETIPDTTPEETLPIETDHPDPDEDWALPEF